MESNLAYEYEEERRAELIDGKVVMMAPASIRHMHTAGRIYRIFANYLDGKKCVPLPDGATVYLTDKNRFVPDMMVVCDRSKIRYDGVYGAPDLVVEILSPSTAKNDRGYKKNVYEANGVPEYWIVDQPHRSIEVYLLRNGRYDLDNIYTLYSAGELAEMTDDEKAAVVTQFKCHLYDDLIIRLEDIFNDFF